MGDSSDLGLGGEAGPRLNGSRTMPWNVNVPPEALGASPTRVPLCTRFKSSLIQQKSSAEGNKPLGIKGRAL